MRISRPLIGIAVLAVMVSAGCGGGGSGGSPGDAQPWQLPGAWAGQQITGPAGIPLVWVPGSTFMMGSEEGEAHEQPVHAVTVSGFWIGRTEVTVAQWRSVMGTVPDEYNDLGDNHPVVNVSWNDCREFCRQAGLALPTEAQWEYAARSTDRNVYPWGDQFDGDRLCYHQNRGPEGRTFPVGSFPGGVSWCGAWEMSGNVNEWCADRYAADYYANSPQVNPTGPTTGEQRVVRGGSHGSSPDDCRGAYRQGEMHYYASAYAGFRVASTPAS